MPKLYSIASVEGRRGAPPNAVNELRSISSLARERTFRALDVLTEVMEHGEDERNRVAAAMAIAKIGGSLGYGETDAKMQAAVEARVREIFAAAKAKAIEVTSEHQGTRDPAVE